MTCTAWEKMYPELVNHILTKIRPRHLQHAYKEILGDRIRLLEKFRCELSRQCRGVFPLLGDFARFPEIEPLLNPSKGQHLTYDSFDSLKPRLPVIVAHWKYGIQRHLHNNLRARIGLHTGYCPIRISNLAIATFICKHCRHIVLPSHYRLAIHRCCNIALPEPIKENEYEATLQKLGLNSYTTAHFYVASQEVLNILEACGKDQFTSVQELDELDPRLTCGPDCGMPGVSAIFNWRDAVSPLYQPAASLLVSQSVLGSSPRISP